MNLDKLLYDDEGEGPGCYERLLGRIMEKEVAADIVSKNLVSDGDYSDTPLFARETVLRHMQVALPTEDFFKFHKRKILNVLRKHLREVKRVAEVFDQF